MVSQSLPEHVEVGDVVPAARDECAVHEFLTERVDVDPNELSGAGLTHRRRCV